MREPRFVGIVRGIVNRGTRNAAATLVAVCLLTVIVLSAVTAWSESSAWLTFVVMLVAWPMGLALGLLALVVFEPYSSHQVSGDRS